jgi:hypothetical protein
MPYGTEYARDFSLSRQEKSTFQIDWFVKRFPSI